MTHQEILEKAIQKAIEGGWEMPEWAQGAKHLAYSKLEVGNEYSLIFNHDFARALWGERRQLTPEECKSKGYRGYGGLGAGVWTIGWQDHLQAMVVADDPIHYLGAHL